MLGDCHDAQICGGFSPPTPCPPLRTLVHWPVPSLIEANRSLALVMSSFAEYCTLVVSRMAHRSTGGVACDASLLSVISFSIDDFESASTVRTRAADASVSPDDSITPYLAPLCASHVKV